TLELPPKGKALAELDIRCERDGRTLHPVTHASALAEAREWQARRRHHVASVTTSNENFNAWFGRSRADIDMLITETEDGPNAYAGIPWFSTTFGRDGII